MSKKILVVFLVMFFVSSLSAITWRHDGTDTMSLSDSGNLVAIGNMTADYFFGDGSQLTGINAGDLADDGTFLLATGDTATGNYTFDTDTFHIDSTNNRVGIGTTSPDNKLTVSGDADITGNLGIGTTSPSYPLEVSTSGYYPAKFVGNTAGSSGYVGSIVEIESNTDTRGKGVYLSTRDLTDSSLNHWFMGTPYASGNFQIGNAGVNDSINSDAGPAHANQAKFTITETGNVGIGTTNPGAKLHVSGGNIDIDNGRYYGALDSTGTRRNLIQYTTGNDVAFTNTQGDIYFNPSGNVGIGTTEPDNKLTVSGDADITGNLGIGTTSPSQKLHVDGNILQTTGDYLATDKVRAIDGDGLLLTDDGGTGIFVKDGGNVGIGTTSPSEKLDVAGNININEASAYLFNGVNGLKLSKNGEELYYSTLVGAGAGNSGNASSARQTALGYFAGRENSGAHQTALGYFAGRENSGAYQTALGYVAGQLNSGDYQTALGHAAGQSNSGDYQTALGYFAGQSNLGDYQTALGYTAGRENSGNRQTALGYTAGYSNSGAHQTALGYTAGRENSGAYQTALGYAAGYSNSGDQVTGIGYEATYLNTADDVVAIGYQAGKSNAVANQFIVKQANINAIPLIQGDFSTGKVGIGTTEPDNKLTVSGDADITGNLGIGTTEPDNKLTVSGDADITGNLGIGTTSPDNKLTVSGDADITGNLGIGTTSPTKKLEINGTAGSLTFDPNVASPTINTTASTNMTITSSGGSVIIKLGG
jgi:hypothetical protein